MTDLEDLPRLLDASSGAPAGLRDALSAAERDVGTPAQLSRLAARLGPVLAVAPAAAPAAMSGAAKLGLAGLALMVAGGGAWLVSTSQSATPPAPTSPAPSVMVPAPARPQATPAAPAPAAPAPAAPASAAPASAAPSVVLAPPAEPPSLPAKPTPPAAPSEAQLLEQARAALKGDPAKALQRTSEAASRYPRGVLVQEREVIAIQALRQLGRSAEADRRAEAFSKAFPGSAFQRKLKPSP